MYLVWAGDVPLSSKLDIRDIDSMEEECRLRSEVAWRGSLELEVPWWGKR